MEKEIITAEYLRYKIIGDIIPPGSMPEVFCIHGAGTSDRKIYNKLRDKLLEKGTSSCSMDFLGHGETGGSLEQSSLKSRTEQAQAIIEKANVVKPLIIIAGSMAAYNAIKLSEIYPVSLLVLSAPAVYDKEAYNINFGEKFSSIIRKINSWYNTDAWEILNKYKGKIIILAGEKDEKIPFEIIQKIYDSSMEASYREIITLPNAPHTIMSSYLQENPEDLQMIVEKIISLITTTEASNT